MPIVRSGNLDLMGLCQFHCSLEEYCLSFSDSVPPSSICSKQPVHVCHNVSFVVDLHKLDDAVDVRADENGVWVRKGSSVAYVSVQYTGKRV